LAAAAVLVVDDVTEEIEQLRAMVADVPPAPDLMAPYLEQVRSRAYTVSDADVAALLAAGVSEDEIFEQTVAVAVAEGLRRLDAGLRASG
jgi:alkylhydroperoxidase family enzyme